MFTLLKSIPKLLGAKVEIRLLYFDPNECETETASYDQAILEKISPKTEVKGLDLTLSQCVVGIKRIPGVQH